MEACNSWQLAKNSKQKAMFRPVPFVAALKIWIAGLLLGPVLLAIGTFFYGLVSTGEPGSTDFIGLPGLWFLMILYGGVFSLPSVLLLWLMLVIQYRFKQSEFAFWVTILTATFCLTMGPFWVLFGLRNSDHEFFGFSLAYLGAIWLGVFWVFYRKSPLPEILQDEPLDANL